MVAVSLHLRASCRVCRGVLGSEDPQSIDQDSRQRKSDLRCSGWSWTSLRRAKGYTTVCRGDRAGCARAVSFEKTDLVISYTFASVELIEEGVVGHAIVPPKGLIRRISGQSCMIDHWRVYHQPGWQGSEQLLATDFWRSGTSLETDHPW